MAASRCTLKTYFRHLTNGYLIGELSLIETRSFVCLNVINICDFE